MTETAITLEGLADLITLEEAIAAAPPVVYFRIRDAFMRIAIDHRTTFLRRLPIKLQKKSGTRDAIGTPKVNEAGADANLDRTLRWSVEPRDVRRPQATEADLDELYFEALSKSVVLAGYEGGISITPKKGKKLAVPIKAPGARGRGRLTPAEFRARNPRAVLIARPSKTRGTLLLFERRRKRSKDPRRRPERGKSGKVRAKQRGILIDTLIPRWALVDKVDLKRALGFYAAWDATSSARQTRLQSALRGIVRDLAAGVRD